MMQQSLYPHPGLLAAPQVPLPPGFPPAPLGFSLDCAVLVRGLRVCGLVDVVENAFARESRKMMSSLSINLPVFMDGCAFSVPIEVVCEFGRVTCSEEIFDSECSCPFIFFWWRRSLVM